MHIEKLAIYILMRFMACFLILEVHWSLSVADTLEIAKGVLISEVSTVQG